MIKLRFVTGSDLTSDAIRAWQKDGWATHVEAVLPDGSLLGAHYEGGVAIRQRGYDDATRTRQMELSLTVLPSMESAFYEFMRAEVGKPYDTTAIVGLVLGRDWREPDSWFCSELVCAALEDCGYFKKLPEINHITPRDVFLILSAEQTIPDAA